MIRSRILILATVILFSLIAMYGTLVSGRSSGISGRSITGCTCHSDNPDPSVGVSIFGPTIVNPDTTYTYTLTLTGGPLVLSGLDVSVTNGALVVTDSTNTQLDSGEITHTSAGTSQTSWSFNWTAPSTYGNATMYGASLSADGNGKTSGDLWNKTFLNITVTILGDIDGDGYVGSADFSVLAGAYGSSQGDPAYNAQADFDGDGYVGSADFSVLAGNYGNSV